MSFYIINSNTDEIYGSGDTVEEAIENLKDGFSCSNNEELIDLIETNSFDVVESTGRNLRIKIVLED